MKTRRNEINYDDFEIEDGVLVKYRGEGGDVVIPDGITDIGFEAFWHTDIKSVIIPNSVTCIGEFAFSCCVDLTSVTIPGSVIRIRNHAFQHCMNLQSVTIGNGVGRIGDYVFSGCSNLKSVTIPDSVKVIGFFTFEDCKGLQRIFVANEEQRDMILNRDNDLPKSTRIIVKGESSGGELNESRKVRLTLGQLRRLVKESDDDPIGAALRKRTHDCAIKIEEAIVDMLDLYTVPSYNYQSDEFRHCFDDVIGILDEVRILISLTDA